MFKRTLAVFLAAVSLFSFASCKKSELIIENEDAAEDVIECTNDNMFGLEKIVVFEDHVVVVLDKKICDDFKYDENDWSAKGNYTLERYLDEEDPKFKLTVINFAPGYDKDCSSSIEVKNEKYVVTVSFDNDESHKEDPNEDFKIYCVWIGDFDIEFDEETVEMEYIARGCDIMFFYTQVYDRSAKTWSRVNENVVGCETQPYV